MLDSLLRDLNPWWADPRARRTQRFPFRRTLQARAREHLLKLDDRRAIVIEGPRQVGKTVLLLQVADELLAAGWPPANLTYFDFSDDRVTTELSARDVVDAIPAHVDPSKPRVLLLDEIGRATNWAAWLKQAVDRGQHRLLVTDSASTLLRSGSRESGQGRWDLVRMEGLTFSEFAQLNEPDVSAQEALRRFPALFERYLARGGYPEHALADSVADVRERTRTDIVDRAIHRDLQPRHNDPRVKTLFRYLVQNSGGIFEARKRSQDLDADYRSVESWKDALLDTLLIAELPSIASSIRAKKALRARPKIYAADHGLIVSFAPLPEPWLDSATRGRIYEAVVFRHLRDQTREGLGYVDAARDQPEIDFVVDMGGKRIAIEVTSGSGGLRDKPSKLRDAGKQVRADGLLLIHGGATEEHHQGIRFVPASSFLLDSTRYLAEVTT